MLRFPDWFGRKLKPVDCGFCRILVRGCTLLITITYFRGVMVIESTNSLTVCHQKDKSLYTIIYGDIVEECVQGFFENIEDQRGRVFMYRR